MGDKMKPYYQDETVTIYHGDCRVILPTLDKANLILTDFPYGNGTQYDVYQDTHDNLSNLVKDVMPKILGGADRVLIACGVANIGLFPEPNWILSWSTPAGVGSGPWGFCCWQPILAYGNDPYLKAGKGRRPDSVVWTERSAESEHPCPKPLGFWEWLMQRGSVNKSDSIVDPFMGTGSTLIVAKKLGRRAMGIEISERYCELAAIQLGKPEEVIDLPIFR